MSASLQIGDRHIGDDHPLYIVAELSANHLGDYERAAKLVREAAAAGADAVKLQMYTADAMTPRDDAGGYRLDRDSPWSGQNLHALYRDAAMPWDWYEKLEIEARAAGIQLFASAFDASSVEFLERLNTPAFKIASFELVDLPLLRIVAAVGKPVILSTGMATIDEIDRAVATLQDAGARQLALLKCASAYPAPPESMNLRGIRTLRERFGVTVGLSDHTLGSTAAIAATALGARIIEKHFTLSRDHGGPDAAFSSEPPEFKAMTVAAREAQRALGDGNLRLDPAEEPQRKLRRSLFVVEAMRPGDEFTTKNVACLRPGLGLPPCDLENVIGRRATRAIPYGAALSWDMID